MVSLAENVDSGQGGQVGARFFWLHYHQLRAIPRAPDRFELTEPPSYFNREFLHWCCFQMSWRDLRNISTGYSKQVTTFRRYLHLQWHRKLAFPLIAPVSMLLAIPFAFLVGTRGAVGGVAIGVTVGIIYWSLAEQLQAMGGIGQLPPFLARLVPRHYFLFPRNSYFFHQKMPT